MDSYTCTLIQEMKKAGKLKALPIVSTNKQTGCIYAADGMELCEYWAKDGTWVPASPVSDGSIRYLGSASHAGHIELKCLYVSVRGQWINILNGEKAPK